MTRRGAVAAGGPAGFSSLVIDTRDDAVEVTGEMASRSTKRITMLTWL
jgi:hypothetical protein